MPICLCGKKFHACSSCGLSNFWEYEYCSRQCWALSKEYAVWKSKFKALYSTINSAQRKFLLDFLTEVGDDYYGELEEWVKGIDPENTYFKRPEPVERDQKPKLKG